MNRDTSSPCHPERSRRIHLMLSAIRGSFGCAQDDKYRSYFNFRILILFFINLISFQLLQAQEQSSSSETTADPKKPRWTSYFISTNPYAKYLNSEFEYVSQIDISDKLKQNIIKLFREDYTKTYEIFKHKTEDEDTIYDLIDVVYERQELFSVFHEYLEILTELEGMGSHIVIHEVDFKKVDVLNRKDDVLTIEAIWAVHGTVRHITHDHNQKNVNCVQFKVDVSEDSALKISSSKVMSIDRFDLYK